MLRALSLAVLLIATALPDSAGFKEGVAAYKRGDYRTAFREMKTLAEQGKAGAKFGIGLMHNKCFGVPKNYALAVKWYRKAAVQGLAAAQYNLDFMYERGRGIPKSCREAVKWYRKAALQGNANAQLNFGIMNATGQGVPKNYTLAYMWWSLSAARGNKTAAKNLEIVAKRMTPAQVVQVMAMAAKWNPKKAKKTK